MLGLYTDHHVPHAITNGSRLRGVDVLPAHENRASELQHPVLLDHTAAFGRVLLTQDDGLLTEAVRRQRRDRPFCRVIYAHQVSVSVGDCMCALEFVAKAGEPSDRPDKLSSCRFDSSMIAILPNKASQQTQSSYPKGKKAETGLVDQIHTDNRRCKRCGR